MRVQSGVTSSVTFLIVMFFYKHGETSCDGLDYWEFSDVSHAHILWEKILW